MWAVDLTDGVTGAEAGATRFALAAYCDPGRKNRILRSRFPRGRTVNEIPSTPDGVSFTVHPVCPQRTPCAAPDVEHARRASTGGHRRLRGRGRTATRAGAPPSFLAPRLCTSILFLLRGPATACIDGLAGAVVTSRLRHVLLRPCLAQPWRHG